MPTRQDLWFFLLYCQHFLAPRLGLGSKMGEININIFFGNNLTSSEVNFSARVKCFMLLKGWTNFVKNNCIEEGNKYAFTFEEETEGGPLSIRVHTLNGVLGSDYDREQPQRPHGSRKGTISLGHIVAVKITASMHIPYLPFARLVADCCPSGYHVKRNKLLSLHEAAVKHLASLYESVDQLASHVVRPYIGDSTMLTPE
ncbi:hypothetical protein C2845_PM05G33860 [Panicum miliaceum]|uniref:Uncharacterized protein n=1 Tax=Panicum miliaceum TaxID=4540 RepID=A0A3L6SXZ4_PANMI|nr:hypothetical protein C2845_PM05G33860 [Panicum miliaceum]